MDYTAAKIFIFKKLENELSSDLSYHGIHHTEDVLKATADLCDFENISEYETMLIKTIEQRIKTEQRIMSEIDSICLSEDGQTRAQRIEQLMHSFDAVGPSTICDEDEMKWPTKFLRFNPLRIIQGALAGGRWG